MRIAALITMATLLLGARVEGATHRVPNDVKDLSQALREAKYGDTVLVFPGKYHLQSRLKSGVKLLSAAGPESTIGISSGSGHSLDWGRKSPTSPAVRPESRMHRRQNRENLREATACPLHRGSVLSP